MDDKLNQKIQEILIALNTSKGLFRYPIGNPELVKVIKLLESRDLIRYNSVRDEWSRVKQKK
jgi:hypothetical protein